MKTKQILNIVMFLLVIIGVFFKMMHWPGAGIILVLTIALFLSLIFIYAIADNKNAGLTSLLNYSVSIALAVFIITLLFKLMHWPGAGILVVLSSILVLVVTGLLVFSKENGNISRQYLMMFFLFVLMLDAILPNNGWKKVFCSHNASEKIEGSIAPTKMNVLYIGVDNPMDIVVSGYNSKDLEVKIDNGEIVRTEYGYIAHPKNTGLATISVSAKGKILKESQFRVKIVPDPVAKICRIKGAGAIDQNLLLEQKGIYAEMENFDFDLRFKVVDFKVTANIGGYTNDYTSKSDQFTKEQLDLIKKVKSGQKVYFEEIKAVGPDGAIRELGAISITVK